MKQLLTNYQIFMKLPQISHTPLNDNFQSIICNFLDQLLHPYINFMAGTCQEYSFFIFASCELLKEATTKPEMEYVKGKKV